MQGKLGDATAHFQRAVGLKPNYTEAQIGLGNVLKEQGKLSEAMASYERVLALRPDYAEAHHNLGTAHLAQDNLTAAISCFERALALRPDNPEAWLGRARRCNANRPESRSWRTGTPLPKRRRSSHRLPPRLGAEEAPLAARRSGWWASIVCDRYDQHVLGALKYRT